MPSRPDTPTEPFPAESTVNIEGTTPTGSMEEKNLDELVDIGGNVPKGTRYGRNGLPRTGDNISGNMVIYCLLCISAFLGLTASLSVLRRKHTDK
ncbi:MAG: hypothetical protein LBT06_11915 [Hungatella sp.]|nr:hypothetical protein [Hungatella sp.]